MEEIIPEATPEVVAEVTPEVLPEVPVVETETPPVVAGQRVE